MVSRDLSSDALTSDWEAWLLLLLLRGTSLRFFKTEQTVTTLMFLQQQELCKVVFAQLGKRIWDQDLRMWWVFVVAGMKSFIT